MENTTENKTEIQAQESAPAPAPKSLDDIADEVMANDTANIVTVDQIIIDIISGIQQLGIRGMLGLKIIERINKRDAGQCDKENCNEPSDS